MTPIARQMHERPHSPFSWMRAFAEAATKFPLPAPFTFGPRSKPRWPAITPANLRHVASIIADVAKAHKLRPADLTGPLRLADLVAARHEAMWRCRHEVIVGGNPISTTEIGRAFNRDHTTAMYGIAKHQARLDERSGRC